MEKVIEYFVSGLVENNLMNEQECSRIYETTGGDIQKYAQSCLNYMTNKLGRKEAEKVVDYIQQLLDYAVEAAGDQPEPTVQDQVAEEVDWSSLPSFDDVENIPDSELGDFMKKVLTSMREVGVSDLHISANAHVFVRYRLNIKKIGENILSPEAAERLNKILLTDEQREIFEKNKDFNFALESGNCRIRSCLMQHKDGVSGAYRLVPDSIKTLSELGFLDKSVSVIERMLDYHNGLILVTGPLGSGKTSTLAAMVEVLNRKRRDHVITVEDPIEIVQPSLGCNVTQREIGTHTKSYNSALKGALREDPDIIVIGELHDLETIEMAITASETGHLVIGTLHTDNAANTLNRLLDVFPPSQQPQIRAMTSGSLRGIICQRLVPQLNDGLTVAYELLVNNMAVSNVVSEGKTHQLNSIMQTGIRSGMCTIDQNLLDLFEHKLISEETALSMMQDKNVIKQLKKLVGK